MGFTAAIPIGRKALNQLYRRLCDVDTMVRDAKAGTLSAEVSEESNVTLTEDGDTALTSYFVNHPVNPMSASPIVPPFTTRVLPVVVITDAAYAVPLARALLAGGIDAIEITLRHPCALPSIEAVAREVPQIKLGAGTLLDPADVRRVMDAGASFALSPGCTPLLAEAAMAAGLPFIPGVMTPSEAMAARSMGFKLMKLFPAVQAGGIAMLKAMSSPLADLRFCPTGGVTPDNLASFLELPNVAMAGGSWLAPSALMASGNWDEISRLAREARLASERV